MILQRIDLIMKENVSSPGDITWDLGPKNDILTAAENPLMNELWKIYAALFV